MRRSRRLSENVNSRPEQMNAALSDGKHWPREIKTNDNRSHAWVDISIDGQRYIFNGNDSVHFDLIEHAEVYGPSRAKRRNTNSPLLHREISIQNCSTSGDGVCFLVSICMSALLQDVLTGVNTYNFDTIENLIAFLMTCTENQLLSMVYPEDIPLIGDSVEFYMRKYGLM